MSANLKETLLTLAAQLPENATWDDVLEEVRFRRRTAGSPRFSLRPFAL